MNVQKSGSGYALAAVCQHSGCRADVVPVKGFGEGSARGRTGLRVRAEQSLESPKKTVENKVQNQDKRAKRG